MRLRLPLAFIFLCALTTQSLAAAVPVKIQKVEGGWQLVRGGKPYYVNGAAGHGYLDLLKRLGGNSVRTWSVHEFETTNLLRDANAHNMTVAAGLAMEPPRHGFNYADPVAVRAQYDRAIAAVEKYKNEPAILVWGSHLSPELRALHSRCRQEVSGKLRLPLGMETGAYTHLVQHASDWRCGQRSSGQDRNGGRHKLRVDRPLARESRTRNLTDQYGCC